MPKLNTIHRIRIPILPHPGPVFSAGELTNNLDFIRQCRMIWHMVTFVESPLFSKIVHDYLTDDEYRGFQSFIGANPDAGDVVRGSGGVRKVRWSRTGKSGGVRILYFARTEAGEVWLLLIYAKSAVDSIPGHILKELKEEMEHVTRRKRTT